MNLRSILREQNLPKIDLAMIVVSVVGSYILRLEPVLFIIDFTLTAVIMIIVSWMIKPVVYRRFGLYNRVWAYASMPELGIISRGVTVASILLIIAMLLLQAIFPFRATPRSVYVIDWLGSMALVGIVRISLRIQAERRRANPMNSGGVKRVLVVGAGDAGALVVRELQKNPQANLLPVAYLDDDIEKQELQIYGVPVTGRLNDLGRQIDSHLLDEVIVAIPSASGSVLREVAEVCRQHGIPFQTMPGIYELIGGVVSINRLREVDITDLLRREPRATDSAKVGESIGGKSVLITGAGGSIASEICRQIARWEPSHLIIVGHGENSIFDILLELKENFPSLKTSAVIADIRDKERLQMIFMRHQPEIIFHAAAHKHVHMMEMNVEEAVTNNILGTRNIVEAALVRKVERLVMISTDKAVSPTSVMGATKRIAEMIVLDSAQRSDCAYSVVRFGNVLGSRGSVVPLFKRQIARGGPITVTDPDVERYFMTIPEAVHLVLQASAIGQKGEMFVLNMGEPVRIIDLAKDLIRLSGLEPGEDIEIVFTGMKPGEKLSEELWDQGVVYQPTDHPDINRIPDNELLKSSSLKKFVDKLIQLAGEGKADEIIQNLDQTIPGAQIRSTPPLDITSV